jgi:hypothetical protein
MDFDYGDVTGDTRVSVFKSWIDSVITGGSTVGSTAVMALGLQATSVPEPASLLMLAAMGLAELRRRR